MGMKREEAKKYIGELKMYAKSQGWDEEYQVACDTAINALKQETVLKERYDHEHVLRKIFETKVDKLRRQLKEQTVKTESIHDKIRAEIEPKCDRINSLASVLPYTAHREIQELLCEIIDLCKVESED